MGQKCVIDQRYALSIPFLSSSHRRNSVERSRVKSTVRYPPPLTPISFTLLYRLRLPRRSQDETTIHPECTKHTFLLPRSYVQASRVNHSITPARPSISSPPFDITVTRLHIHSDGSTDRLDWIRGIKGKDKGKGAYPFSFFSYKSSSEQMGWCVSLYLHISSPIFIPQQGRGVAYSLPPSLSVRECETRRNYYYDKAKRNTKSVCISTTCLPRLSSTS